MEWIPIQNFHIGEPAPNKLYCCKFFIVGARSGTSPVHEENLPLATFLISLTITTKRLVSSTA